MPAITFNQLWNNLFLQQHIFCITLSLLFAVVRPYRVDMLLYNNVDTLLFGMMAIVSILSEYNVQLVKDTRNDSTAALITEVILITLPLIYIASRLWVKVIMPAKRRFFESRTFLDLSNKFSWRQTNNDLFHGPKRMTV